MDAAKVADAVVSRLLNQPTGDINLLRDVIIEEIGKEVVAEACACVKFRKMDQS